MKIPNKLIIGETQYKIKMKRVINWNKEIGGQINYNYNLLILKKGMSKKILESSFFHEIAHGILKELEFNYPKISNFRDNEKFVQEMGLVLRKTFLDLLEKQEK